MTAERMDLMTIGNTVEMLRELLAVSESVGPQFDAQYEAAITEKMKYGLPYGCAKLAIRTDIDEVTGLSWHELLTAVGVCRELRRVLKNPNIIAALGAVGRL